MRIRPQRRLRLLFLLALLQLVGRGGLYTPPASQPRLRSLQAQLVLAGHLQCQILALVPGRMLPQLSLQLTPMPTRTGHIPRLNIMEPTGLQ